MKKLLAVCVLLTLLLFANGSSYGVLAAPVGSFVKINIAQHSLEMGQVDWQGLNTLSAKLKAHVTSNCPYQIEVSFRGFKNTNGQGMLSEEDTSVMINGVPVSETQGRVPIVSSVEPTASGGVDVPIKVECSIRNPIRYKAGKYRGVITFTVMATP